jgi:hypothetical protein
MSTVSTPTMPVGGVRPSDGVVSPADLVVRNAKIHTGDPARPSATAVAIRDGVFAAVGDEADVAGHVGPGTRIVDALGRRAIPGLNDSHTHVIRGGGNYLLELRWDGVPSLATALRMLKEQAERTPPGQWVRVVGGWTAEQFAERRLPTLKELNAAAPDTPVFVLHLYQSALLNRAALNAVGFTRESPNPPGGEIVRDHAGEPTGLLLAAPGAAILYSTLAKGPVLDPGQQANSTRHFLRELNRFGITSAIDAAGGFQSFPDNYGVIMGLAEREELTVRIAYHLFPQTGGQELEDLRRWVTTVTPGDGDAWLRLNGAGENLTWSAADFENFAEPRPQLAANAAKDVETAARLLIENGWGFRLHSTYDETIRQDLDVFERIAADLGGGLGGGLSSDGLGVPWLFDHAETVTPHSLERIRALGGNIAVQDRMMFQAKPFIARYGRRAARYAPPVRRMLATGITVGAGTDATRVSSYNPWLSLYWLTVGKAVGGTQLYGPDNLVDRATALAMYTVSGAELSGEAEHKGTVTVGKYADLAVLSADYFTVPDEQIPYIESVLTIAGGRIVYADDEHEGFAPPLPPIDPAWSPVAHYGGYHADPDGVRQARTVLDAVADSAEHTRWREGRGEHVAVLDALHSDPLDGCF